MKLRKLAIVLAVGLAAACVGPTSKSPKKSEPKSFNVVDGAGNNAVDDMPDDSVTPTNNGTNNNVEPAAVCGNGVVEIGEECDGAVDESCADLGFDGGVTSCSATCQVDATQCTRVTCGDGVVQAAETCDDGADNGSYDMCSDNCSGLAEYCGDNITNGPEACDGAPPVGASCQSYGFDGGTLACSGACGVDTSGCSTCGDGIVGDGETCDDGSLNGTYGNCNALCTGLGATCGDGIINGPEQCDGAQTAGATCESLGAGRGDVSCNTSCRIDTSTCSLAPAVGEVIITEIMQNPAVQADNDGEFFEVYNTTGRLLDLDGCTIESSTASGAEDFVINGSVSISAGGYAVFARSSNAPFVADYTYGGSINLNNSVDELAIICTQPGGGSAEIDRVSYDDGVSYPDPTGASMVLDPRRLNAQDNDYGSNWCTSVSSFGVGDLGTPGAPNDYCF